MEIRELKQLLIQSWSLETCSPGLRKKWSKDNPSLGQCAITALIINDYFGGKIMRCMSSTGSYYYNLINCEIIDLTVDQFLGETPQYEKGEERTREYLLGNDDIKKRYETLLSNLKQTISQIRGKKYKLIDSSGKEYLSDSPGTLGGNKKLKIYGKLDCPSAKRWIEKGYYVSNRVFFENETVAINAGYRPCAICMPDKYKAWKQNQIREKRFQMCVSQRESNESLLEEENILKYLNYDNLNLDEELEKIENCEIAEIILEPSNKKCLFILGMLFVNGVRIKILNEKELDLEKTSKSFSLMPYVWSKIGDNDFPLPDYSDIKNEMDQRIENIKRIGVRINKIIDNPIENKIFLICPVRNATYEQRKWIEDFVKEKYNDGYIIHAPHLHTRQMDLFGGYAICMQNAYAVASSQEVDIYYDQSSTGSVFDLGVAYALHKPLRILNKDDIIFNDSDLIDTIIKSWPYNDRINVKALKL